MPTASPPFEQLFNTPPEFRATAPGRVNLLGEHTDYNDGFVLPTAIPQQTCVEVARSRDGLFHLFAAALDEYAEFDPGEDVPVGFGAYVYGCIRVLESMGRSVPPVAVRVTSDVPMGSGLSSSAALEVAVLRALRGLLKLDLDDVEVAQAAQRAEIEYAHVRCGIMDQMASSLADADHMLFLDTRTLERRLLPLPEEAEIVVVDSGVPRTLAGSKYNERRDECEAAARRLGVAALRDVTDVRAADALPEPLNRRVRHVVSENNRVLEAASGNLDAQRFGQLMNESHASLRDDYEVSIGALDTLVGLLQQNPRIYGARLTGAGFGGACVALGKPGARESVREQVLPQYEAAGYRGRLLV